MKTNKQKNKNKNKNKNKYCNHVINKQHLGLFKMKLKSNTCKQKTLRPSLTFQYFDHMIANAHTFICKKGEYIW